jgi:fibronectin type 3 domain-containing protein
MVGKTAGRAANLRSASAMVGEAVSLAVKPVIERLEDRWLMSGSTSIQPAAGSVSAATLAAAPQVATLSASKPLIVFNSIATGHTGAAASPNGAITITNTGTATLTFGATVGTGAFTIVNDLTNATQDAALFKIVNLSSLPSSLAPGQSFKIQLNYTAKAVGRNAALLQIQSNDPANPTTTIQVHGIGTSGLGGSNEPALDRILRAYNIPTIVGQGPNDSDESSYLYPVTPDPSSQEVPMQLLQKAGPGLITITDLANFTDQSTPAFKFGFYNPNTPQKLVELFYINKADSQSVNPTPQGATVFDPGNSPFGLYFQSPLQDNGQPRIGYSQSAYNTWDSTQQQKFRFFPMENPDGSVVPNTFIVTTTEWNAPVGYDFHNIVAIIHNVKAAPDAAAAPVLSVQSPDFAPNTTNLLFSKVQVQPTPPILQPDGTYHYPVNNVVHDTDTLTINNTGDQALVINSLTLSSKAWTIVNPPAAGTSIAPGGSLAISIKFIATTEPAHSYNQTNSTYNPNYGGIYSGTLTINSNDQAHPTQAVNLSGWWQYQDERDMEPSLQSLVNTIAGYGTQIAPTYMNDYVQTNSTLPTYYGEEVVSPYWTQADSNVPVNVLALASWHTESYAAVAGGAVTTTNQTFGWYPAYTHTKNTLLTVSGSDAQTVLPHPIINGVEVAQNATASFSTTGNFGFVVDGYEYSDDSMTPQQSVDPTTGIGFGPGGGHVMRFFPMRLSTGKLVPNTYIVGLDYNAIPGQNFDFQDGVWIVSGIRPAGIRENNPATGVSPVATTPAPIDVHAVPATGGGVMLQWAQVSSYTSAVGYNVYSSTNLNGPFTLLTTTPLTSIGFTDSTAVAGKVNYYRVTEVNPTTGLESTGAGTASLAAPAAPAGLTALPTTAGVALTWTANTEATLAGYNVYRSLYPTEGFTLLNTSGLLTSAAFNDTTAPGGATSYYLVTAVDTSGNEGASSAVNAVGGSGAVLTAPSPVNGLTTSANLSGVTLNWQVETGQYMAGYNIYSSTSLNGPFALLNTAGLLSVGTTSYKDTTAQAGVVTYYQVVAVDVFGNASQPANASATRLMAPPTPTGVLATAPITGGVTLTWNAATGNLVGYNVYRSTSLNGTYVLLNTGGPLTSPAYTDSSAPTSATAYYQVKSVDGTGDLSAPASASVAVPKPVPAPVAPANLTATAPAAGGVVLTWNANTEADLAGYNVFRSTSANGMFTLLNTDGLLTTPTYTDASAAANTTFYYQVVAVDTQQRVSPMAVVKVTTPIPPAPTAPTGLQATVSPAGITLSWNANAESDIAGYKVFRASAPGGPFIQVSPGMVQAGTSFVDTGAAIGTASYYEVVAIDIYGNASPVTTITATRPATAPVAPKGLTAVPSVKSVTLSWNANGETNLAGYQVFRATSAGGAYQQLNAGTQTGRTFVDTTAPIGVVSYYKVVAVNNLGMASTATTISAKRLPANTPATTPVGFAATATPAGVSLTWDAATGPAADNLAGYYVYRSYQAHGIYHKLNARLLSASTLSFKDTTATAKVKVFYQLVAISPTGVHSAPAWLSTTRPAAPKVKKTVRRK